MKNSFLLYTDYMEQLELLSLEQRGVLLTAVMLHSMGKDLPEMDAVTKMAFSFIRADLDRATKKYDETVGKRKAAGKAGGEAKADKAKQLLANVANAKFARNDVANVANASFATNGLANAVDNDNDNENVNDNNNPPYPPLPGGDTPRTPKTKKEKEQHNLRLLAQYAAPYTMSTPLYETLTKWAVYKGQHNFAYEPLGMQSLLTIVNKSVKQYGEAAVIERISASMADGYAGMLLDKLEKARSGTTQKPKSRFHNLEQRPADDIDQEAIAMMKARILGKGAAGG